MGGGRQLQQPQWSAQLSGPAEGSGQQRRRGRRHTWRSSSPSPSRNEDQQQRRQHQGVAGEEAAEKPAASSLPAKRAPAVAWELPQRPTCSSASEPQKQRHRGHSSPSQAPVYEAPSPSPPSLLRSEAAEGPEEPAEEPPPALAQRPPASTAPGMHIPSKEGRVRAIWHDQLAVPLQWLPDLLEGWGARYTWIFLRIWGKLVAHLRVPDTKVSALRSKGQQAAWDNVNTNWPRLTQTLKGEKQPEKDPQVAIARSETLLGIECLLVSRKTVRPATGTQGWLTGKRLRSTLSELCQIWGQQPQEQLPVVNVVGNPATLLQAQAFVQILGRLLDQWPQAAKEDGPLEICPSLPPTNPTSPPDQELVDPGSRTGQTQHLAPALPRADLNREAPEGKDQSPPGSPKERDSQQQQSGSAFQPQPPASPQEPTPEVSRVFQPPPQLRDTWLQTSSPSAHLPTQDSQSSCLVPPPSMEKPVDKLEKCPAQAAPRREVVQGQQQKMLMDATPREGEGEQTTRLLGKRATSTPQALMPTSLGAPPAKSRPQQQPGREGPASVALQGTPSAPLQGAAVPRHQPDRAQSSPAPPSPAQPGPPAQHWPMDSDHSVTLEGQGEPVNALGRLIFPQLEFENTSWEEPTALDLEEPPVDLAEYERFVIQFQAGPSFPQAHLRAYVIQNIIKRGMGFPLHQLVAVILHESQTELDVCFKSDRALCQFWRECRLLARSAPQLFEEVLPGVLHRGNATTVYIAFHTTTIPLADVAVWLQRFAHILAGPEKVRDSDGMWTGEFRVRVRFKEGGRRAFPKQFYLGHELGVTRYKGQPPPCSHCGSIQQCRISGPSSARCDLCQALGHSYAQCPTSARFTQRQQGLQAVVRVRPMNVLRPRARPAPGARDPQQQPPEAQPPLDGAGPGPQP